MLGQGVTSGKLFKNNWIGDVLGVPRHPDLLERSADGGVSDLFYNADRFDPPDWQLECFIENSEAPWLFEMKLTQVAKGHFWLADVGEAY